MDGETRKGVGCCPLPPPPLCPSLTPRQSRPQSRRRRGGWPRGRRRRRLPARTGEAAAGRGWAGRPHWQTASAAPLSLLVCVGAWLCSAGRPRQGAREMGCQVRGYGQAIVINQWGAGRAPEMKSGSERTRLAKKTGASFLTFLSPRQPLFPAAPFPTTPSPPLPPQTTTMVVLGLDAVLSGQPAGISKTKVRQKVAGRGANKKT